MNLQTEPQAQATNIRGIPWAALREEKFRLMTFMDYPDTAVKSAFLLAQAGFVYTGPGERCLCFFCGISTQEWQEDRDIQGTHLDLSPACPMVTGAGCANVPLTLDPLAATAGVQGVSDRRENSRTQSPNASSNNQVFSGTPGMQSNRSSLPAASSLNTERDTPGPKSLPSSAAGSSPPRSSLSLNSFSSSSVLGFPGVAHPFNRAMFSSLPSASGLAARLYNPDSFSDSRRSRSEPFPSRHGAFSQQTAVTGPNAIGADSPADTFGSYSISNFSGAAAFTNYTASVSPSSNPTGSTSEPNVSVSGSLSKTSSSKSRQHSPGTASLVNSWGAAALPKNFESLTNFAASATPLSRTGQNDVTDDVGRPMPTINATAPSLPTAQKPPHMSLMSNQQPADDDPSHPTRSSLQPRQGASCDTSQVPAPLEPARSQPLTHRDLGIITERPKRCEYGSHSQRLQSYNNWPTGHLLTEQELADAGFYYSGYSDCVRCFFCGGGLRNWDDDDDIWIEHARWFPKCAFLRQKIGQRFIDTVQSLGSHNMVISMRMVKEQMGVANITIQSGEEELRKDPAVETLRGMGYREVDILDAAAKLKETGQILSADELYAELNSRRAPRKHRRRHIDQAPSLTGESNKTVSELKAKNKEARQQLTCKVCLDKPVAIVFLPCGHLVCCVNCALAVLDCPFCRTRIKGIVHAHIGT